MSIDGKGLVLCGMKGCGKTFYLEKLKQRNIDGFDTDEFLLEGCPGCSSIREVYQTLGRKKFRQEESDAIQHIFNLVEGHGFDRYAIATGGGLAENPAALSVIENSRRKKSFTFTTVFLDVPAEVLLERVRSKGVPAFIDPAHFEEQFLTLTNVRRKLYSNFCDFMIEWESCGESDKVTDQLLSLF